MLSGTWGSTDSMSGALCALSHQTEYSIVITTRLSLPHRGDQSALMHRAKFSDVLGMLRGLT
jgi:hypothetical protein